MAVSRERLREITANFLHRVREKVMVEDKPQFKVSLAMVATGCLSFLALSLLSDARTGIDNKIQMLNDRWLDTLIQAQREEWIWAERKEDRTFPETLIAEQLSRRYRTDRLDYISQNGNDPQSQRDGLTWGMVPATLGFILLFPGAAFLFGSFGRRPHSTLASTHPKS